MRRSRDVIVSSVVATHETGIGEAGRNPLEGQQEAFSMVTNPERRDLQRQMHRLSSSAFTGVCVQQTSNMSNIILSRLGDSSGATGPRCSQYVLLASLWH